MFIGTTKRWQQSLRLYNQPLEFWDTWLRTLLIESASVWRWAARQLWVVFSKSSSSTLVMRKLFSYEIYGNIITRLPRWIVNINPAITYLSSFNTYSSSSLSSRLFSCTGNRVVHAKPEEYKNAALFLQFGLLLIGYKHGVFRKTFLKPEVENVGFMF